MWIFYSTTVYLIFSISGMYHSKPSCPEDVPSNRDVMEILGLILQRLNLKDCIPQLERIIRLRLRNEQDRTAVKVWQRDPNDPGSPDFANLLKALQVLGAPFNGIRAIRLREPFEIQLHVDSDEAFRALSNQVTEQRLRQTLRVTDQAVRVPDLYWVQLHDFSIDRRVLNACGKNPAIKDQWKFETGLQIHSVEWKCHRLLWSFETREEAMRACRERLWFHAASAVAIPFDKRAIPAFCLRCGLPDHMKDQCEGPCINCGGGHKTESVQCEDPAVQEYRRKCKRYADVKPTWALSMGFSTLSGLPELLAHLDQDKGSCLACRNMKRTSKNGATKKKSCGPPEAPQSYVAFVNPDSPAQHRSAKAAEKANAPVNLSTVASPEVIVIDAMDPSPTQPQCPSKTRSSTGQATQISPDLEGQTPQSNSPLVDLEFGRPQVADSVPTSSNPLYTSSEPSSSQSSASQPAAAGLVRKRGPGRPPKCDVRTSKRLRHDETLIACFERQRTSGFPNNDAPVVLNEHAPSKGNTEWSDTEEE
ncbi:hypothetical protein EKO04_006357 [Ascochyta lentis]|uniref:CCHC-type domain-containing protein n=1 Tax=Ascochyta lentis TaxID=205686 RepID=A0A8H7MCY3_9PLEO|nr:hypothetical protein EKO04_006357 [Ascochyta lentis]